MEYKESVLQSDLGVGVVEEGFPEEATGMQRWSQWLAVVQQSVWELGLAEGADEDLQSEGTPLGWEEGVEEHSLLEKKPLGPRAQGVQGERFVMGWERQWTEKWTLNKWSAPPRGL